MAKDIKIWYDCKLKDYNEPKVKSFDLEDGWDFLIGKVVHKISLNKIPRNKSYLLNWFLSDIMSSFIRCSPSEFEKKIIDSGIKVYFPSKEELQCN